MESENVRLLASTDSLDPVWFISTYQNLLISLPLCAGISLDLLEPFLLKCEYRSLEPQEQLLSPGQVNQYLYVVVSGS